MSEYSLFIVSAIFLFMRKTKVYFPTFGFDGKKSGAKIDFFEIYQVVVFAKFAVNCGVPMKVLIKYNSACPILLN